MSRCCRVLLVLLAFYCVLPQAFARERGPRVEVTCPAAPIPVSVAGKQVLVYELHVTNFDMVPLELKRVQVFPDAVTNSPVKDIAEASLPAIMQEAGAMGGVKSTLIEPAQRAILFLWVELPADTAPPASLRHRMVFSTIGDASKPAAEATLQDFPVPVSKAGVPVLSPPFNGGIWAGAGIGNDTDHRRSIFAIDGSLHSPERFAIDWVKVGPNGDARRGTARNEDWWAYGESIYAVADGEVTQVMDGIPENKPRVLPSQVTLDNIAGNYVVQRIAPNRYATYAHLQNGSIVVRPHQQVHRGDVLAKLGNTGNTTGPHLHFQVTDADSVLQSEGVPFVFEGFTWFGPGAEYEADKPHPSVPRARSLPEDNAVVEFKNIK